MCRAAILELMHQNAAVADKIMTCFALGLGLPEDFFRWDSHGIRVQQFSITLQTAP